MLTSNYEAVLAINENDLSQLAMDILSLSDDVADIFSSIDQKMESLGTCFSGKEYDHMMSVYRTFRKNYTNVKNSIIAYSDDLICVINKVRAGDNSIAFLINQIADETLEEAKNIKNNGGVI